MNSGALTLRTFPHDTVRLACPKCGRRGQYHRARMVGRFGPDVAMPDVLRELAQCRDWQDMSRPCRALYPDLKRA